MPPQESRAIDTLRLKPRDRQQLVDDLNRHSAAVSTDLNRRGVRVHYNVGIIVLAITHPNGNTVRYAVAARNLSANGVAFIHGQFVYRGSAAQVLLPRLDRRWERIDGSVFNCRHIGGLMHEVSVVFHQSVDLRQFVRLTDADTAAVASSQESQNPADWLLDGTPLVGRALLMDGFEPDRKLYAMWLQKRGLEVIEATTVQGAVQAAGQHALDLVIMDLCLGSDDGLSLVRRWREAGFAGTIVAVTADEEESTQAKALAAGCNAFLTKPFSPGTLYRVLDQLVGQPAPDAPTEEPIRSTLAQLPEMKPLLTAFVAGLGAKVTQLQAALHEGNRVAAARLCQQLKGAGTSHGFALLTDAARAAQEQFQCPTADPTALRQALDALVRVAARLKA